MNLRCIVVPAVVLLLVHPWRACAQESSERASLPPLLPEAEEIALAESAAPEDIARDAAIYVLGRDGYTLARSGRNGFTCLVERSHPASLEPICYDAEGTATILPRVLEVAALRRSGADPAAVRTAIAEGYRVGRFRAPQRPGVAYMLSPATRFYNPETGKVEPGHPHVMFYAPYLRNENIGSPGEFGVTGTGMPFVIEEGSPDAYIVVLVGGAEPCTVGRADGLVNGMGL